MLKQTADKNTFLSLENNTNYVHGWALYIPAVQSEPFHRRTYYVSSTVITIDK